jgi:4'-phosphopantetheinyl transferase
MELAGASSQLVPSQDSWVQPTLPLTLLGDEVHVWRFGLKQPERFEAEFTSSLSEEERSKVASLYFREERRRYAVARGILRTILGLYMNIEPVRLQFYYDPHGKPILKGNTCANAGLQFSLSHSHDLALCAIAMGRGVGVDLEHVQGIPDIEHVASLFFSKQEAALMKTMSGSQRLYAFYSIWTQREAYAKATGTGLDEALGVIDVLSHRYEKTSSSSEQETNEPFWSALPVSPAPGYVGTLVVEGCDPNIHRFQFNPCPSGVTMMRLWPM